MDVCIGMRMGMCLGARFFFDRVAPARAVVVQVPIERAIESRIERSIERSIECSIECAIESRIERSIERSIECSIEHSPQNNFFMLDERGKRFRFKEHGMWRTKDTPPKTREQKQKCV